MVDASIYQMMRGIIVVLTAALAFLFLGRKQHRHHILSIFLIVIGVAEVGWVAIKWPDPLNGVGTSSNTSTGIILLLISQFFIAC